MGRRNGFRSTVDAPFCREFEIDTALVFDAKLIKLLLKH